MKSLLMFASTWMLAGALSLSAQSVPPGADHDNGTDGNLVGVYACQGLTPKGAEYRGTVEIVRHNGTYQLLWTFRDERQVGIGIVSGDVLAVSYFGGMPGLVVYRI